MKLTFFGAARAVTGSCHCVECGGKKILVDCGLQQGTSTPWWSPTPTSTTPAASPCW